jgi:Ig-like domain CHU_C associated
VIGYLIPNFGRAPGVGTAGSVIVAPCAPPSFIEQPRGTVVLPGQTATLTARATGATTYRWYAGTKLVGTGETFTTPKLFASTEYVVEAENACGTVRSDVARVVIASRRRSVR